VKTPISKGESLNCILFKRNFYLYAADSLRVKRIRNRFYIFIYCMKAHELRVSSKNPKVGLPDFRIFFRSLPPLMSSTGQDQKCTLEYMFSTFCYHPVAIWSQQRDKTWLINFFDRAGHVSFPVTYNEPMTSQNRKTEKGSYFSTP